MTTPTSPVILNQGFTKFYIGKPGAMQRLVMPDSAWTQTGPSRAETAHTQASGGTTATRRRKLKRGYTLNFTGMTPDTADQLMGYYSGAYGSGPFCFIDPSYRNVMSLDAGSMGAPVGAISSWSTSTSAQAPFLDTAFASPAVGSAVLHWPSPVNTSYLYQGKQAAGVYTPDSNYAPPWLSDQPFVFSVWLRTVSGTTSAQVGVFGLPLVGTAAPATALSATLTLTTTWTRYTVVAAIGAAGFSAAATPYLGGAVRCTSAGSTGILAAAAQYEYGVSAANPWVLGVGLPRMTISAPMGSSPLLVQRRNHSLTLSET